MKLLAFAASNSRHSINKKLVTYATNLMKNVEVDLIDINDYTMPMFSIDLEIESSIPQAAHRFYDKIGAADALLISFAEHNHSYTAAYKSLFDWASRIHARVYQDKPMVMLSTSSGARGGANVLENALATARIFGADVKASLSVPSFHMIYDFETGDITDPEIRKQLAEAMNSLLAGTELG